MIIAPLIVIICVVGAYSVSNSYLDVVMMLGFGIVGYLFKKLFYPLAPLVLAIVIGDKAEDAFRQSMLMSKGSLGIFFANKLVTCLIVAGIALCCFRSCCSLRACCGSLRRPPTRRQPKRERKRELKRPLGRK